MPNCLLQAAKNTDYFVITISIVVLRVLMTLVLSLTCILCIGQFSVVHQQRIQEVSNLPVESMSALNNELLVTQELSKRSIDRAPQFAHPFAVNLSPTSAGTWEYLDAKAIWRIVLESKDAFSINLGFTDFYLPSTASLYIYDYYGADKIRPFIAADNEVHEKLWTPIIASDKVIVEVNLSKEEIDQLRLQLSFVNHDFMDIERSISDACHIDVKCGEANGYPGIEDFRDQIRSVGMYTINGTSTCSGFLINNTRQDCKPYFMTANHCNLNSKNAASMVTYWNYENSYCREPGSNDSAADGDGQFSQFNSGAELRATWQESDFTLVEMDDEIPKEVNAYFCGWDISSNPPSRGTIIHHPNLEEKRISFKYSPLYLGTWGQEATPIANGNHLIVNDWDLGSTDDGSSGAPLLNRQGLAVGQLHGGLASCDNQDYDAFGRLFSSWTGGGMPESRLKDWLDPDNLGLLNLQGKNCVFNIELSDNNISKCGTDGFFEVGVTVDESFQGIVELTFEALPLGAFAFYNQTMVNPGQTATLSVTNLQNLAEGDYSFTLVAQDQFQTQRIQLHFTIDTSTANHPLLISPSHKELVDEDNIQLEWEDVSSAKSYKLQIANDLGFTQNFNERITSVNSFELNGLVEANQDYYWRVKSINACGESGWSFANQFTVVNIVCEEVFSDEEQVIDSEMPNIIYSSIWNTTRGDVMEIEVNNIKGEHSFVSDLQVSLISPQGTEVLLFQDVCSSSRDFDLGFSDEGLLNIACPPTDGRIYKPGDPLSAFIGESAVGEWVLKVEDKNNFDGGKLLSWALNICVNPAIDFSLTADVKSIIICSNESYNIPLSLGSSFNENANLNFQSNIPNLTEISQVNGGINLLVNPSGMASPGNYPIIITVLDTAGNSAEYTLDLIVIIAPTSFDLSEPEDDEVLPIGIVDLKWENATFASEYIVVVATDELLLNEVLRDTVQNLNYSIANSLEAGRTYFWQINARNRCGNISSKVRRFTLEKSNSVHEFDQDLIEIYPNPANKLIFIKSANNRIGDLEVSIKSVDGKAYYDEIIEENTSFKTIPIHTWPNGIYLVSAKCQTRVKISRIVVQ